jgi:hypothetical protein
MLTEASYKVRDFQPQPGMESARQCLGLNIFQSLSLSSGSQGLGFVSRLNCLGKHTYSHHWLQHDCSLSLTPSAYYYYYYYA